MSATGDDDPDRSEGAGPGDADRYRLGVLFVHGIGHQRRGDTLVRWTEALLGWCDRRWPSPIHATPRDARLDDPQIPPHVAVRMLVGGEASEWLFAEAWWAKSLATPTFLELVNWSFRVVPWSFASHASTALHRNTARIGEAAWWSKPFWAARLVLVAGTGLVLALLAFPIVLVGLVVMTLLGLLPIPTVRTLVRRTQRLIAGTVGDAMVLLESPVQAAAVLGGVRRDLDWLTGRCRSIVVVGHSQGAAIAVEALRSYPADGSGPQEDQQDRQEDQENRQEDQENRREGRCSLFTFGSGVQKLESLRALRDSRSRWVPWAATAVVLTLAAAGGLLVRRLLDGSISGREIAGGLGTILVGLGVVVGTTVLMSLRSMGELRRSLEEHRTEIDRKYFALEDDVGPALGPSVSDRLEALGYRGPRIDDRWALPEPEKRWWEDVDWTYFAGIAIFLSFQEFFRRFADLSLVSWLTFLGLVLFLLAVAYVVHRIPPGQVLDAPRSISSWTDVYASADPIPNGPLLQAPVRRWEGDRRVATSQRVWNLRSFVTDHSQYWQNTDTFVPRLVRVLCDEAGSPLPGLTDEVLEAADRSRRRRVAVLKYLRIAVVGAAIGGLIVLRGRLDEIGQRTLDRSVDALGAIPFGLERLLPDTPGDTTLYGMGAGLVVATAVAAYHALFLVWRGWNGAMARRFQPGAS